MGLTTEQENIRDYRDCDILVSAAAGSGKTFVLVQRILSMITDPEHPVDIDRLLVVTFTKAAASEMKERITREIASRLEENPGDANLERQSILVHNAKICTIDSFCNYVVSNYFYKTEVQPGFRLADEQEVKLLSHDIFEEMLEEYYEDGSEDFLDFMENYMNDRRDGQLEDYIFDLYKYAQSEPYPEKWLSEVGKDPKKEDASSWEYQLLSYVRTVMNAAREELLMGIRLCETDDHFEKTKELLTKDLAWIENIPVPESYEQCYDAFHEAREWDKFASYKCGKDEPKEELDALKDLILAGRNRAKNGIKSLGELTVLPGEEVRRFNARTEPMIDVLRNMTLDFMVRLKLAKAEKCILDFADIEHLALEILVDKETGSPTEVALDFAGYFEEIMIDEYQDSNFLQEYILMSVSKENLPGKEKKHNVFCVGDVKQSIYRFRQARPELFNRRYETYTTEKSAQTRVELRMNFRSFPTVLEDVNRLCGCIMRKDMGGIDYDDNVALHPCENYKKYNDDIRNKTELYIVDKETQKEGDAIRELILKITDEKDGLAIYDKKTDAFRTAQYKDICILSSALKNKEAMEIADILRAGGIPLKVEGRTDFFQTLEVGLVRDALSVLENPLQDLPLVGLMRGPLWAFSNEEMARIGAYAKEERIPFHQSVFAYTAEEGTELCDRLADFRAWIDAQRQKASTTGIGAFLTTFYEETGLPAIVLSMPEGKVRLANLEKLLRIARTYEKSSYRSLYHFVRYLDVCREETKETEAEPPEGGGNEVQFMTMHKSKGLEFPVVILANLSGKLQFPSGASMVRLHPYMGISVRYIDHKKRLKYDTIRHKIFEKVEKKENYGERTRLLYVAATRAEQKLYMMMTASEKEREKSLAQFERPFPIKDGDFMPPLSFLHRIQSTSMTQWILASYARYGAEYTPRNMEELTEEHARRTFAYGMLRRQFEEEAGEQVQPVTEVPKEPLYFPEKVSVSAIKKDPAVSEELFEEGAPMFVFDKDDLYVPRFAAQKTQEVSLGTFRGSAYHRVLECLNFAAIDASFDTDKIKDLMDALVAEGKCKQAQREQVNEEDLVRFFKTPLFLRMKKAAEAGDLYREHPFVMGVPGREVYGPSAQEETVLIQGVIDACFLEDEAWVLVDYKTDRLMEEEAFLARYSRQMHYYKEALERGTGKHVKEILLYAFAPAKEIKVAE